MLFVYENPNYNESCKESLKSLPSNSILSKSYRIFKSKKLKIFEMLLSWKRNKHKKCIKFMVSLFHRVTFWESYPFNEIILCVLSKSLNIIYNVKQRIIWCSFSQIYNQKLILIDVKLLIIFSLISRFYCKTKFLHLFLNLENLPF